MDILEEHISALVELGLNPAQAKVYLTLLGTKIPNARMISKASEVSRPEVYRVLRELGEMGFVDKIIAKPEKFRPIPVEDCVSILLQRRIKKTQQLQKETLKLTQAFKEKKPFEEADPKLAFILISGRNAVYAKTEKMLKSTQEKICILGLPRRLVALFSYCWANLEEALARNVDCRIIMSKSEKCLREPLKSLAKHPNFNIKMIPEQPETAFSVWDRKQILMGTSVIDAAHPVPVLWSDNKNIVNLGQEYFEHLWLKAEKVDLNV